MDGSAGLQQGQVRNGNITRFWLELSLTFLVKPKKYRKINIM